MDKSFFGKKKKKAFTRIATEEKNSYKHVYSLKLSPIGDHPRPRKKKKKWEKKNTVRIERHRKGGKVVPVPIS